VLQVPLGLLLGAALALAFPPFGWWPLAPLVVALTTWLVRPDRLRRAMLLGFATGLGFFLVLLHWMQVVGSDAWIALSALEASFYALLFGGVALVRRLPGWPVWTACLWVLTELAREYLPFGGFPWGRLAFAQADAPYGALGSLGGFASVTFAVALTGALLAAAASAPSRLRRVGLVLGAFVLPAVALLIPLPVDGSTSTIAVIQGNVPTSGLDAFGQRQAVLDNHVAATRRLAVDIAAGRSPRPALVVWPENASDIDPFADPAAAALIQSAVDAVDAPVLVGAVITNPADPTTILNVGILWGPTNSAAAGPGQQYAKRHPVPFGEYLPFRGVLSHVITRFNRIPRDFAAGQHPGLFTVGPLTIGDVICFEVAYDDVVRDVVTGGGELITVQTNNATYGHTGQVEQQFAVTQLRAVEHGRAVAVAATSGISGFIQPDGTVTAQTPEFVQQALVEPMPRRTALTLADRVGSVPELVLVMVGGAALVVALARSRRRQTHSAEEPAAVDR